VENVPVLDTMSGLMVKPPTQESPSSDTGCFCHCPSPSHVLCGMEILHLVSQIPSPSEEMPNRLKEERNSRVTAFSERFSTVVYDRIAAISL